MYSLTIVGGGAVSCGYDDPNDKNITTHIHGALKHPKINLNSIIEVDNQRHEYISNKWGKHIPIFLNINDSLGRHKSDIFVIATPTDQHFINIKEILAKYSPKLLICEKPIVSDSKDLEKLYKLVNEHSTKIITNFPRRFDKSLNILKEEILKSNHKYHFYGTFNKGLIHNGCHMIDLINMLVGPVNKIDPINYSIIDSDFFGKFLVNTNSCSGVISNISSNKLGIFDLTIYTDKAKFEIIGAEEKITINYINTKPNHNQDFEVYLKKDELPYTLNKSAYNTFEYVVDLLENEKIYRDIELEQHTVNKIIFDFKNKFMKPN
jgi:predicted dehydrogenase